MLYEKTYHIFILTPSLMSDISRGLLHSRWYLLIAIPMSWILYKQKLLESDTILFTSIGTTLIIITTNHIDTGETMVIILEITPHLIGAILTEAV